MTVFHFKTYRDFLLERINENRDLRGYKGQLAKAANCHRSALAQILSGQVNLTLDQAAGLCLFWGLDQRETDYFLELVSLERAATPQLRSVVSRRLEALKSESEDLKNRFPSSRTLSEAFQSLYYSDWYWVAIHVLVSIPGFRTEQAISRRLNLPSSIVRRVLGALETMKVLRKSSKGWEVRDHDVFLPRESHMTTMNHYNWRQRAIQDIQLSVPGAIHYTNVHALSRSDLERFRSEVLACIDRTKAIVDPSSEEEMVCFTCDVFRV